MNASGEEIYDAVILGSGQAGTPLAAELGRAGWRVAIVERQHWGGTCVNEGCTPTKWMIACAETAYRARQAGHFGVQVGDVRVDLSEVRRLKRQLVESFAGGSERGLRQVPNVTLVSGEGTFTGMRQVSVHGPSVPRTLSASRIFINTGARPARPVVPGLHLTPYLLDSTSIMELHEVPERLVVIGGGAIGLEFAQMYARFGSDVTVLHSGSQLLDREDPDIAAELLRALHAEGLEIQLMVTDLRIEANLDGSVTVRYETPDRHYATATRHVLVATGRVPNTDRLNLPLTGIEVDHHGFVQVDRSLKTSAEGIWALGDVKGGPAFTHVAYDDFRIVRAQLLGTPRAAPPLATSTLFTDPQLGRVGLNEREARAAGYDVLVATLPMNRVARAIETGRTDGLMKAVVDRQTHRILGAAILGPEGGEVAAAVQMAMMGGLPFTRLRDAVISHPTLAESLNNLFMTLGDVPPPGDASPPSPEGAMHA